MLKLNHLFPMKRHRKKLPTSIKIITTWLSTIKVQKLHFYCYLYYHSDVVLLSIEGPQHDQIPPSYYGSPFPLIYHNLFKLGLYNYGTHIVKWYLLYNCTTDKFKIKYIGTTVWTHLIQKTFVFTFVQLNTNIHQDW